MWKNDSWSLRIHSLFSTVAYSFEYSKTLLQFFGANHFCNVDKTKISGQNLHFFVWIWWSSTEQQFQIACGVRVSKKNRVFIPENLQKSKNSPNFSEGALNLSLLRCTARETRLCFVAGWKFPLRRYSENFTEIEQVCVKKQLSRWARVSSPPPCELNYRFIAFNGSHIAWRRAEP